VGSNPTGSATEINMLVVKKLKKMLLRIEPIIRPRAFLDNNIRCALALLIFVLMLILVNV
jgi:hypothetical protein